MAAVVSPTLLLSLVLLSSLVMLRCSCLPWDPVIRMPTPTPTTDDETGTRWAVLVAGSSGFENYRHQADVCHAYQLLRKGGLKEENIVVFMYDDIADNPDNPRPGVLINHPTGQDVYKGVPKDYTGEQVTCQNLYAVLLGNKTAVEGGSGKVVDSKSNDHIFIYYADHGAPGVLGMPNEPYLLYAADFIEVLKKKHASNSYKKMVIYVEACESGSIFEGMMPEDLNIYVTTAANAEESSWATYCPGDYPPPPAEYLTCLGDLYSVSWMEDSETSNLKEETIEKQYQVVKERTYLSNVMEYGTKALKQDKLYLYQGFDPSSKAADNISDNAIRPMNAVSQRDEDLLFLWRKYQKLDEKSDEKAKTLDEILEKLTHRKHLDKSIQLIGYLIFGDAASSILTRYRPREALVNDWDCLKSMVRLFEYQCGPLTQYGMKHMRAFANICNQGIHQSVMQKACISACSQGFNSTAI